MENKLLESLRSIINTLSSNTKLNFDNEDLFKISSTDITTPIGNPLILLKEKSKLKDKIIDLNLLKDLVNYFNNDDSIIRLNHIGFGYLVDSKQSEKQKLVKLVQKTEFYLYEEESNDFGLWLFMGNTDKWQDILVEFVPVEKSNKNYDQYLPHIQIDIDTKCSSVEIDNLIKKYFGNKITSYHIAVINGITNIVKIKLGVIDGVNIFLDLATNSRNVKYHRENLLKKIS